MNKDALAKVPEVTIGFWIIKVLVTTLGETGGDAVTMSMQLGYAAGSVIFLLLFVATVAAQVGARRFHPYLYWAAIIASTTVGTTLADLVDRSLGIGYAGGSTLLALALLASLALWKRSTGSVDMGSVDSRKAESFYWVTILFSQTLGTALGDWTADTAGLGYAGSAMAFGSLLLLVALAYFRTGISRTVLFWAAFVLTRPLGAVVGDFLDKPLQQGGLDVSRYAASAALLGLVAMLVLALPHRAAQRAH
ncbi:hypothetical protein [Luteimonas mephitis]|uniref:COG4705 family protein n=1 Tax=Luteimonas mephitis TaxID=83615 RepID=UPI003A92D4D6